MRKVLNDMNLGWSCSYTSLNFLWKVQSHFFFRRKVYELIMTIIISFQNFVLPIIINVHIKVSAILRTILASQLRVSSHIKLSIDKTFVDLFCLLLIKLTMESVKFPLSICPNVKVRRSGCILEITRSKKQSI